jgi:hypothetical protein
MLNGVLALLAPASGQEIPIHVGTNAFLMPRLQEVIRSIAQQEDIMVFRLSLVLVKYSVRKYLGNNLLKSYSLTAPGFRGLFN